MHRRTFLFGMCSSAIWAQGETPVSLKGGGGEEKGLHIQKVRYGFAIRNHTDKFIDAAQVSVYAPVAMCATHQCAELHTTPVGQMDKDAIGNQTVSFTVERFAPRAITLIRIRADVLVGKVQESATGELGLFMRPDQWIQSDHPVIVKAAQKIVTGRNETEKARSIYEWVSGHLKDTRDVRSNLGAVCAYLTGRGDCTESAVLFAALARASGIPSRVCSGFLLNGRAILTPAQHHNWAEFHDGKRWRLADPNQAHFCDQEERYMTVQIWSAGLEKIGFVRTGCEALDVRMLG